MFEGVTSRERSDRYWLNIVKRRNESEDLMMKLLSFISGRRYNFLAMNKLKKYFHDK